MDRLETKISGRVQGVGYRYSIHREALKLGITGWVRNMPDGSVEAEFEGSKPALEKMLEFCQIGPAFAQVTRVESHWDSGPARYTVFQIR